jgi:hypothetical protein
MIKEVVEGLFHAKDAARTFFGKLLAAEQKVLKDLRRKIDPSEWNSPVKLWIHLSPAQKFLIWRFVVSPFLSDLKAILKSPRDAVKRLKWLQKHNGKPVLIKLRRPRFWTPELGSEYEIDISSLGLYPEGKVQMWHWPGQPGHGPETVSTSVVARLTDYEITYTAQAWAKFDIPRDLLEGVPSVVAVWGHLVGLDNPIGFLWEWLRFSWLIDWFLSYRARLWQKMLHLGEIPDAQILEQGYAFKIYATYDIIQRASAWDDNDLSTRVDSYWNLGKCDVRLYTRMHGKLQTEAVYFRLPFSWQQLTLLWAVIEQRIWRHLQKRRH